MRLSRSDLYVGILVDDLDELVVRRRLVEDVQRKAVELNNQARWLGIAERRAVLCSPVADNNEPIDDGEAHVFVDITESTELNAPCEEGQ